MRGLGPGGLAVVFCFFAGGLAEGESEEDRPRALFLSALFLGARFGGAGEGGFNFAAASIAAFSLRAFSWARRSRCFRAFVRGDNGLRNELIGFQTFLGFAGERRGDRRGDTLAMRGDCRVGDMVRIAAVERPWRCCYCCRNAATMPPTVINSEAAAMDCRASVERIKSGVGETN